MKKTNVLFRLSITLFALNIVIAGCKKDDPDPDPNSGNGVISDVTIPINDSSSFNMKNFAASFVQLFVSSERWSSDFTHKLSNGNVTETQHNYKIFGVFGKNIQTTTHNFNEDGVITSSNRISNSHGSELAFEYEYDIEGYIIKLTKILEDDIFDVVSFEYNAQKKLITKTHVAKNGQIADNIETFTYNTDGTVASWKSVKIYTENTYIYEYKYTYTNGNMTQVKEYDNDQLDATLNFQYDSKNRITKSEYENDNEFTVYEYNSNDMSFKQYNDNLLKYETLYEAGLIEIMEKKYFYNNEEFIYCTGKENDEDGFTKKKYYYSGSIENLQLSGYTIIDSRDSSSNKKTKESVYDSSDTKLYYAEFVIENGEITATNWFAADGSAITAGDITELWVFLLIK